MPTRELQRVSPDDTEESEWNQDPTPGANAVSVLTANPRSAESMTSCDNDLPASIREANSEVSSLCCRGSTAPNHTLGEGGERDGVWTRSPFEFHRA